MSELTSIFLTGVDTLETVEYNEDEVSFFSERKWSQSGPCGGMNVLLCRIRLFSELLVTLRTLERSQLQVD